MKSKIKHIVKFEFLRAAKTKGFIIGIILVPLMFIGIIAITKILAEKSTDHSEDKISVGVCTAVQDSTLAEIVASIKSMNWEIVESPDKDALRSMTFEKKIRGYIEYDSVAGYNFYADNYTDLYVSNTISGIVYNINRRNEIMRSGLSSDQIEKILHPASVNTLNGRNIQRPRGSLQKADVRLRVCLLDNDVGDDVCAGHRHVGARRQDHQNS